MVTFTPPRNPDAVSYRRTRNYRMRRVQYGDGYEQRAADGINVQGDALSLTWSILTEADADTLAAFFDARGGTEAFDYTLFNEGVSQKWVVPNWQKTWLRANRYTVTATFERVYEQ